MPALGSVHKAKINYGDVSQEVSSLEVYVGPITALSIAGFLTQFGTLQTATDAVTLGVRRSQSWTGDYSTISNGWPTDPAAHRENKLLVDYWDTVTEEQFTLTIPTIDFTKLNFIPEAGDAVYMTGASASTEMAAWTAAFTAIGRTPRSDANAIEVLGGRYVGRNT